MLYFKSRIALLISEEDAIIEYFGANSPEGPWFRVVSSMDYSSLAVELSWNPMRYPDGQAKAYPAVIGYNTKESFLLAQEIEDWFAFLEEAADVDAVLEKSKKFIDGSLEHVQLLNTDYLRQRYAEKLYELGCSSAILAAFELTR